MFRHSIPVFPLLYTSHSCVWPIFWYFPIPNGYALWLIYIDTYLVCYSYVWISTLTIVLIVTWPLVILTSNLTSIFQILYIGYTSESIFAYSEILLACFIHNSMLTSIQAMLCSNKFWTCGCWLRILRPAIVGWHSAQAEASCPKPLQIQLLAE